MPIGISFYTFQILSYVYDVYKGKVKVQKNIIKLATYVARCIENEVLMYLRSNKIFIPPK